MTHTPRADMPKPAAVHVLSRNKTNQSGHPATVSSSAVHQTHPASPEPLLYRHHHIPAPSPPHYTPLMFPPAPREVRCRWTDSCLVHNPPTPHLFPPPPFPSQASPDLLLQDHHLIHHHLLLLEHQQPAERLWRVWPHSRHLPPLRVCHRRAVPAVVHGKTRACC